MQIPFYTDSLIEEFSKKNSRIFPDAPNKCPHKDCGKIVKLKKHGYYSRYFISKRFSGVIYIRRYICPICGKTVSLIPIYCIKSFQYSGIDIIEMLHDFYQSGIPLKKFIDKLRVDLPAIDRRHINYYRKRVIENRKLIQYGLNLISPELIYMGSIPEDQIWAKDFLEKINNLHPHVFLADFFKHTGKSFMTLQNILA